MSGRFEATVNNAHSVGVVGGHAILVHMAVTFMGLAAFSELLHHKFLNVDGWFGLAVGVAGSYALPAAIGTITRCNIERSFNNYNTRSGPIVPAQQHYIEFWLHYGMASVLKVMLAVAFGVFRAQHTKDNLHEFDKHRYTSEGLQKTELAGFHNQWQSFMLLTVFTWAVCTVTLVKMIARMRNPILRALSGEDTIPLTG